MDVLLERVRTRVNNALGEREAHRVLGILAAKPAYQHKNIPIKKLELLITLGAASIVGERGGDFGRYGNLQEVRITELGRRLAPSPPSTP